MPDNNMNLNAFYRHALQWQHQKEEAERLEAENETYAIEDTWKKIFDIVRAELSIEGMTIHATETGQFNKMPVFAQLIQLDCLVVPGEARKTAQVLDENTFGVVRVHLRYEVIAGAGEWKVYRYSTPGHKSAGHYDNPFEAFLAVYDPVKNVS